VLDVNANRLSRWQIVQAIQEQIWRSWSKDYLHSLQNRNKWSEPQQDVMVNNLIIVRNPLLPPSKWKLVRIVEVHPGSDGHVHVMIV